MELKVSKLIETVHLYRMGVTPGYVINRNQWRYANQKYYGHLPDFNTAIENKSNDCL